MKKRMIIMIGLIMTLSIGCNKNTNNTKNNIQITNTNPITVTVTDTQKEKTFADIMNPYRYIAEGLKFYVDSDWLNKQEWYNVDTSISPDLNSYTSEGYILPRDNITEDTVCIANLNTKKAEYIQFKGKFTLEEFNKHIIKGTIDYVHKENTEEGYAIAVHTVYNDEKLCYLLRYGQDGTDLWYIGIVDQNLNRFYQFGYSEQIDFELIDISDMITDSELELCSCGCDDILGTCTEDEDCSDPVDGCLDDAVILD